MWKELNIFPQYLNDFIFSIEILLLKRIRIDFIYMEAFIITFASSSSWFFHVDLLHIFYFSLFLFFFRSFIRICTPSSYTSRLNLCTKRNVIFVYTVVVYSLFCRNEEFVFVLVEQIVATLTVQSHNCFSFSTLRFFLKLDSFIVLWIVNCWSLMCIFHLSK